MNTKRLTPLATALLLASLHSQFSTVFAQGSLTPPDAPAPTMKTLSQMEPRTPISIAPLTITNAGAYYLTTNLGVNAGNAVTIAANNVTLDLSGFTIASTAVSATGSGVLLSGVRNITILNGFIQGGVTNNGAGVYAGSGFESGIGWELNPPVNVRVSGVSVSGCLKDGISLSTDATTVVESSTVRTVGGQGIYASTVRSCTAADCGTNAIAGDQVSDCRGKTTGSGNGVSAATAQNCYGWSSTGTGVNAQTAQNCSGFSGSGTGVNAATAQNCYGYCTNNGTGLSATVALNCSGYCETGGYGLSAATTANTCYGYSPNGTALRAFIANSCRGVTATGTNLDVSFKYNMP